MPLPGRKGEADGERESGCGDSKVCNYTEGSVPGGLALATLKIRYLVSKREC